MKDQLQLVIEQMRKHVLRNLELIKGNESHIKEILNWPLSVERTNELNDSYKFSKTLLSENNDFINLQVSIMNFLNKYKNSIDTEDTPVKVNVTTNAAYAHNLSREDYFRLTVESDIAFDKKHPYYNDKEFYQELFLWFENNENYEMCAQLLKHKE